MASKIPVRRFALTLARSNARQTTTSSSVCLHETSLAAAATLRPNTAAVAVALARNDGTLCELKLSAAGAQRGGDESTRAVALAAAAIVGVALAGASTARDDDGALSDGGGALCEGVVSNQQLLNPRDTRGHYALFNEIGRGGATDCLSFVLLL